MIEYLCSDFLLLGCTDCGRLKEWFTEFKPNTKAVRKAASSKCPHCAEGVPRLGDRLVPLHFWEFGQNDIPCQWEMDKCDKRYISREQVLMHYINDHRGVTVTRIPLILRLHGVSEASMALHLQVSRHSYGVSAWKDGELLARFKCEPDK